MTQESAALLVPNDITPAMITAGTSVPVVDSGRGEVAWSSSTAYTGSENHINYNGRLYSAVAASTNVPPGTDTTKWRDTGPTNRMAPFDELLSTQARATGSIEYVLRPGFFNGLALYGLLGEQIEITIYDAPGGTIVEHWTQELWEQPLGLYEYLFMPLRVLTKKIISDLQLYQDPELHIKITSAGSGAVGIGMIALGFWSTLLGSAVDFGGVEYGASAQVKTYSYIKTEEDGTTTIIPRAPATNITCDVVIGAEQANAAAEILLQVAAKPVAFVASGLPRYAYLNTFGLVSGTVTPDSWRHARINLSVKGYI